MRYLKKVLTWSRFTFAALVFGVGCAALAWLLVLFALSALLAVLALVTVALVPLLVIGAGVKLWPGGGLRVTDRAGVVVTFWGTVFDAIRNQMRRTADAKAAASAASSSAAADAMFLRGKPVGRA